MAEIAQKANFQMVVSDTKATKCGESVTSQEAAPQCYYFAERKDEGPIFLQALNEQHVPTGNKDPVAMEEFVARYHPETLRYFNQVLPAMEKLQQKLVKAEKHLQNNKLDKAEAAFKDVLAVDSENIKAVFGLGTTYLTGGNKESAAEIFSKIMSLELAFKPEQAGMFNEFGIKMRKSGMLENALTYYKKALAQQDKDENLYFNLARVSFEMENIEASMEYVNKALELNPDFKEAQQMKNFIAKSSENKSPQPGSEKPQ